MKYKNKKSGNKITAYIKETDKIKVSCRSRYP